jgi:hypothetical protein
MDADARRGGAPRFAQDAFWNGMDAAQKFKVQF